MATLALHFDNAPIREAIIAIQVHDLPDSIVEELRKLPHEVGVSRGRSRSLGFARDDNLLEDANCSRGKRKVPRLRIRFAFANLMLRSG